MSKNSTFKLNKVDSYEEFLNLDENMLTDDVKKLQSLSDYMLYNDKSKENLFELIDKLYINIEPIRPNWDYYFMNVAQEVAKRSNCVKQRVGAIIIKDGRILSTGYNGTPKGIDNCFKGGVCERCDNNFNQGEALDKCICIHAEENAIVEIGRRACQGATLYTTCYPCLMCTKLIVQVELKEIVYLFEYNSEATAKLLRDSGINLRILKPIKKVYN